MKRELFLSGDDHGGAKKIKKDLMRLKTWRGLRSHLIFVFHTLLLHVRFLHLHIYTHLSTWQHIPFLDLNKKENRE